MQPTQQGPDLHELALSAEKSAEQLATGLAHAGVDPSVTKAVTQAADVFRKVAGALGKGQAQTADTAPPAPQPQAPPQHRPTMDQGIAAVHASQHQPPPPHGGY